MERASGIRFFFSARGVNIHSEAYLLWWNSTTGLDLGDWLPPQPTEGIEDRIGAPFEGLEVARLYRLHTVRKRERAEDARKTAWAQAMDEAR